MPDIIIWMAISIVAWLGVREIITIVVVKSKTGPLKPGQRLCHSAMFAVYWGSCTVAILSWTWYPLLIGVAIAYLLRKKIIKSGEIVYCREIELVSAAKRGEYDKVITLIDQGADINFQRSTEEGLNVLHIAACHHKTDMLKYVLSKGANIDIVNHNGLTAMHMAAFCNNIEAAAILLEHGASVNSKARNNITPLHSAASKGQSAMVKYLISKGANACEKTKDKGMTPSDYARRWGYHEVSDLLEKHQESLPKDSL